MLSGTITATYLCGATFFVQVTSPSGQMALYALPWATAQSEGMPGVLAAIEAAGIAWAPQIVMPLWVQQLTGQVVTF